ncbi:MAG: TerD family protein [Clostridium sp.]|uniref:TerD family protein n=1 Tax=Clostridium sp. TaxID=1506 RepID=UPI000E1517C1|nr:MULTISPECIES: TerD family protein [Clostridium]MDU7251861.1 TerD family protein [Clostridium sp.]SUY64402.1 general stress protein [Clostridium sporogenes]HDK7167821.1 TerD family protein [Clostridium botulinum]
MKLIVDRGKRNINSLQKNRYGNLTIDSTIKNSKPVISLLDIKNNINSNNINVKSFNQNNNMNSNNTNVRSFNQDNNINSNSTNVKSFNQDNNIVKEKTKNIKIKALVNTNTSMKILRGQKISLNQKSPNLSKLMVALEWEIKNDFNKKLELDTSIFMVDKNNTTLEQDFIFYSNLKSTQGGVALKSDHNSNLKNGYDEVVQLDLTKIPLNIEKLAFTVTIYEAEERRKTFKNISNAYFRLIDTYTKKEILNYKFDEQLSDETAVVVAEIYRYKGEWKINCIGSGFRGGLKALCDNYGIETE